MWLKCCHSDTVYHFWAIEGGRFYILSQWKTTNESGDDMAMMILVVFVAAVSVTFKQIVYGVEFGL